MTTPTLLLSPDESRDASGAITPTLAGAVTIVAGQHGNAWRFAASGDRVSVPVAGQMDANQGTVLLRYRRAIDSGATTYMLAAGAYGTAGNAWTSLRLSTTDVHESAWRQAAGAIQQVAGGAATLSAWTTVAATWNGTALRILVDGVPTGTGTRDAVTTAFSSGNIELGSWSSAAANFLNGDIESALTYASVLPDSEIASISGMGAWTWNALAPSRITTLLTIGASHIGPMRVGRN